MNNREIDSETIKFLQPAQDRGPVSGFCIYGNESSGSKVGNFLKIKS